ncbi:hypothetical protein RIF24_14130 [Exiguobacterium acetylicum]|uniref:hypothetical protein n=1 Tax=Exiguobacterium acetylicum TaxID=41170 RepID=UPI0039775814
MEIRKKFLNQLTNLSVSIPIPQQRIQEVLAKQIDELENIQVLITPEELEISGYVTIKKFGLSRKQRVALFLAPQRVDGRVIYFNVLKVKPLDMEASNTTYLSKPPLTHYENRILRLDLSTLDLLQKTQYGSLRHLTLGDEEIKVGLGV